MRKKNILFISYLAAAVIAFGGMVYKNHLEVEGYNRFINNSYQRSFTELVSSINEIDTALAKVKYSTTAPMINAITTQIFGKSMAAKMSLGELPFSDYDLTETAGFITRVGDYSYALSVLTAGGDMPLKKDLENLQSLSLTAAALSSKLTQIEAEVGHGTMSVSKLTNSEKRVDQTEENASPTNIGDSFKLIESEFPEIPSLIYDGPFSGHVEAQKPLLIAGMPEVDAETARLKAAEFLDVPLERTSSIGDRGGRIPAYLVNASTDRGDVTVLVTQQGGVVLSIVDGFFADAANISPEGAVDIAKNFLADHWFPEMHSSYWTVSNNVALINFASLQDGVICYPDLVKVSVSLDTGSIIGYEAVGYVTNHTMRNLPQVIVPEIEAKKVVSPSLTILKHALTVIPTDGKLEVLCHEFKCLSPEGRHYLVYVDAQTGKEKKILILLEDEGGTLTI